MKSKPAPASDSSSLDLKKSLLETFSIAHHRGQIASLARQAGFPVSQKTNFGLWEWGTLWRECGFGK